MKKMLLFVLALAACGFVAGCGNDSKSGGGSGSVSSTNNYTVRISPRPDGIQYEAHGKFTATVYESGNPIDMENIKVLWGIDKSAFGFFSSPNEPVTEFTANPEPASTMSFKPKGGGDAPDPGGNPIPPDEYRITVTYTWGGSSQFCQDYIDFKGGNVDTSSGTVWLAGIEN
ncbi:MAG: hypothetical protein FWC57_04545 [Endomicrobia bacterium]|nr:hypothetical protein [Endomicrobiia bacterium]